MRKAKSAQDATPQEHRAERQAEAIDWATQLAADRTVLAVERTYAAWVRTGLAALAAGIGARALLDNIVATWFAGATGSALILFSAFCFIAAVWREMAQIAPHADTRRIPPAMLIAMNGFLVIVCLAALVGIWAR